MLWAFGIFPSISGEKLLTRRSMDYSETRTLLLKRISNVEFLNIVFLFLRGAETIFHTALCIVVLELV